MMFNNGYIELNQPIAGGLDANGNPIHSGEQWGARIPCYIQDNYFRFQSRITAEGGFRAARYDVLMDDQPFEGTVVRLTMEDGSFLGQYTVVSVERLIGVNALRVLL